MGAENTEFIRSRCRWSGNRFADQYRGLQLPMGENGKHIEQDSNLQLQSYETNVLLQTASEDQEKLFAWETTLLVSVVVSSTYLLRAGCVNGGVKHLPSTSGYG